MDPLSITAGCVALITAISTCTKCITSFAVSCRDARQDLASLSRELSDLDMTLNILKDDVDANASHPLPQSLRKRICGIMENCDKVLNELQALVKKYDGDGLEIKTRWA